MQCLGYSQRIIYIQMGREVYYSMVKMSLKRLRIYHFHILTKLLGDCKVNVWQIYG